MTFETINDTHISKLAELYVETYNAPPWNDAWTLSAAAQKLDEMINCRDAYGLVCCDEEGKSIGAIVGASEAYYDCRQFFIKDFFVAPAMQGKGVGTALMHALERNLKEKGVAKTYLFTSRGDQTEQYYHRRGYKSWNGMVMMGKDLGGETAGNLA